MSVANSNPNQPCPDPDPNPSTHQGLEDVGLANANPNPKHLTHQGLEHVSLLVAGHEEVERHVGVAAELAREDLSK